MQIYAHGCGHVALGVSCRRAPPACPQLAEPRLCAASQAGGAIFANGYEDSTIKMTFSGSVITGCSAVAGTSWVRTVASTLTPSVGPLSTADRAHTCP